MATAVLHTVLNNHPIGTAVSFAREAKPSQTVSDRTKEPSTTDSSNELIRRIDHAIRRNPHLSGKQVFCQEQSGVVVLHGRVSTYFQKQMAQETLKRLEGIEKIVNQLEVEWQT